MAQKRRMEHTPSLLGYHPFYVPCQNTDQLISMADAVFPGFSLVYQAIHSDHTSISDSMVNKLMENPRDLINLIPFFAFRAEVLRVLWKKIPVYLCRLLADTGIYNANVSAERVSMWMSSEWKWYETEKELLHALSERLDLVSKLRGNSLVYISALEQLSALMRMQECDFVSIRRQYSPAKTREEAIASLRNSLNEAAVAAGLASLPFVTALLEAQDAVIAAEKLNNTSKQIVERNQPGFSFKCLGRDEILPVVQRYQAAWDLYGYGLEFSTDLRFVLENWRLRLCNQADKQTLSAGSRYAEDELESKSSAPKLPRLQLDTSPKNDSAGTDNSVISVSTPVKEALGIDPGLQLDPFKSRVIRQKSAVQLRAIFGKKGSTAQPQGPR